MNVYQTAVFQRLALISLLASGLSTVSFSQSLDEVSEMKCVYGDCQQGRGTLELTTPYGKGEYIGNFRDGIFDGYGRLRVPISFMENSIYVGNWEMGVRNGRGTYWNGKGNLYIGQWKDDKRNGRGAYFFNLPEWRENEHSEFWLSENTENYSGDFVNDFYHGQGTFRWPGGQKYIGGFFANAKHGYGTYYYATGTKRNQLWHYGDFVE